MRVWAYEDEVALAALRQAERPDPQPRDGEILIRMAAAALNYRDLAIARGDYHVGVSAPLIPLSDGAGHVVALGRGVTRFAVGDLVCPTYMPDWIDGEVTPAVARRRLGGPSDGVMCELMCVHQSAAVRAPAHLSPVEAAALPIAGVTAWHSLNVVGRLTAGDTIAALGAGGVSMSAIQFAAAAGARVISILRSERHRQAVVDAGADDVIVGGGDDWARGVLALTAGRGADAVVDVAGSATLRQSIASTAVGGRVHLVGYASGTSAGFDIFEAIRHAVTISMGRGGHRTSFEAMVRAMEANAIHPVVDRVFPWSALPAALDHLATGGPAGKVVLDLAPPSDHPGTGD